MPAKQPDARARRLIPCARVSTRDQGDNGTSLDTQTEACVRYIERLGALNMPPVAEDVSGVLPMREREGGQRILRSLEQHAADGVVWYAVDRFSRDHIEAMVQIRDWLRAGVEVHFVDIGQVKNENDILLLVRAWQSTDERSKIRERTMRGKYARARQNRVMRSRTSRYGYRFADETLIVVEEEAGVVRLIFRWYIYGLNDDEATADYPAHEPLAVRHIAALLYEKRIPTRSDTAGSVSPARRALPCEWRTSVIHSILSDSIYVGRYIYGRGGETPTTIQVPRIIDDETFAAARERMAHNQRFNPRNRRHSYLLSARVRCACGCSMFGRSVHAGGKPGGHLNLYYVCSSQTMPRSYVTRCDAPHFNATRIDDQVWRDVRAMLLDPRVLIEGIRQMQADAGQRNQILLARAARVDRDLAALDQSSARLLSAYVRGLFTDAEVTAQKGEIERQRAILSEERAGITSQLSAVVSESDLTRFEETCEEIAAGLDLADFETRRKYLQWLDAEIILRVVDGEKRAETTISINGLRVPVAHAL